MSIRSLTRLARIASGSFAVGNSSDATVVPSSCAAQRIPSSYELVAGNGVRSFHSIRSSFTPSSFTHPRVSALVAVIACSSLLLYTMGAAGKEASSSQEKGDEETGSQQEKGDEETGSQQIKGDEETGEETDSRWDGFRWDKFAEYMRGKGACGAIAVISSVEGVHWMKTGKLVKFSPQQLVDCLGPDGCGGCSPREAYQYICKEGVILDADYPYMGISGPCRSKGLPVASQINGYFHVYVGGDERELMRAVAKQPVEITICATGSFINHEGDCTLEPEDFAIGEDTEYNHSVLLVGYGADDDGLYWKIKNSWGPTWGDRGFAKLRRGVKDPNGTGGMTRPGAFAFFPVMD